MNCDKYNKFNGSCPFCGGSEKTGCIAEISAFALEFQSRIIFDNKSRAGKSAISLLVQRSKYLKDIVNLGAKNER